MLLLGLLSLVIVIFVTILFQQLFDSNEPIEGFNYDSFKKKRIWIIGSSGSGKSTLSLMLSQVLNIPCLHMDEVRFKKNTPGFVLKTADEKLKIVNNFLENNDYWLIESTIKEANEYLLNNVDILIWLDLPLHICFFRVLKRTFHRILYNHKLFNSENREQLKNVLKIWSDDSILTYTIRYYSIRKSSKEAIFKKFEGISFHITNYKQLNVSGFIFFRKIIL